MDRPYGPKGFTDRIIGAFHEYIDQPGGFRRNYSRFDALPAEMLLAVAETLPMPNLECRQNAGPPVQAFIDLALAVPDATFIGYIISRVRDDECLSIDGVVLPPEVDPLTTPIGPYLPADEDDLIAILLGTGRRLWWD